MLKFQKILFETKTKTIKLTDKLRLQPILEGIVEVNRLIGALKKDDAQEANDALFALIQNATIRKPWEDLGIPQKDYKELANLVRLKDLAKARQVLGIELTGGPVDPDAPVDTSKINPFTGRPWPSTGTQSTKSSKPSKKLTAQDFKVGDRVRVLEDTQPVGGQLGIPAGTELEVVTVGSYWVEVKDSKQNHFNFYDQSVVTSAAARRATGAAKRTLDNLEKI